MPEPKTTQNNADVNKFLDRLDDSKKRADCQTVLDLMQEITGEPAKMWGSSIIGFGTYHYKYANGREGDWMAIGFSPRKTNLTLYIMDGYDKYQDLLKRLGKHSTGKSCLYIRQLSDIDQNVLRELVQRSVVYMQQTYPPS